jgi:signal transduction histidine kinase
MMTSVLMGVAGLTHDGRSVLAIRAIWISSAIVALLILLNPLTGILFSLDEAGGLARGPLFFLPYLLICAQALVVLVVVIAERPQLPPYVMVRLRMCMAVFTLTSLCDVMLPGLELAYPCVSLLYVVLVMGVEARQREELILARTEASESRARLLSGQISNHFVFNSLAAIRERIAMDPPVAEQAVIDFSDYLRSHLDVMSTTRLVPFSQELDHVRHYVSLEMADASEPLEVRYDLEVEDFLVPPLTVQPLVENAIRHGIGTREEGGTVTVATRRAEKAIEISVTDDGRGFSSATACQDERDRVGLQNVRERLERQCSGTLTVEGCEGGTTATMVTPMGEDA